MPLELQHLPADVLGLDDWARAALSERPRPRTTPGTIVPAGLGDFPRPDPRLEAQERIELARVLEERLTSFKPHVAVLDSVRRLREPGAALVLAGQQPALLGGPLYDLYKGLHVVALARALETRLGTPVLPAFWNHADDHDVAEVHHLWIQNPNLDLRKLSLAGLSSGRVPLGRIRFDQERQRLGALRELLRQNLWEGPDQDATLELFLPRHGESFSNAFTRCLLGLCGHLGLIVVEPDWIRPLLSRQLAELVTRDVAAALARGAEEVRASGREPAIDPGTAALVFRLVDGKRHALRAHEDGFAYDGESGGRTARELAAEIIQEPDSWSAGALLRPVLQDRALPVAAYVGGWGELAYHAQLSPLREAAGAPATPFVPRLSATLVDAEAREALAKLGLTVEELLRARGRFAPGDEAGTPASGVAQRLRELALGSQRGLLALREDVAAIDRGLAQQLKRTADQVADLVAKLATKLDRVQANSSGSGRRHQRRLANGLFPNDQPQERVRGALEFVARHGRSWIDELAAALEPLPTEHLVVYL